MSGAPGLGLSSAAISRWEAEQLHSNQHYGLSLSLPCEQAGPTDKCVKTKKDKMATLKMNLGYCSCLTLLGILSQLEPLKHPRVPGSVQVSGDTLLPPTPEALGGNLFPTKEHGGACHCSQALIQTQISAW